MSDIVTEIVADKRSGLATACLVLGIVGIVGSWIPIINFFSIVIGFVGLGLGIPALIIYLTKKKGSLGIIISGLILCALTLIIAFSINYVAGNLLKDSLSESMNNVTKSEQITPDENNNTSSEQMTPEPTKVVDPNTVGDYKVVVKSFKLAKDYNGKPAISVTYKWTNNSDSAIAFTWAVSAKAFQDGIQCDTAYFVNDNSATNSLKEIQPGKSLQVVKSYELNNKKTSVKIEISESISFNDDEKIVKVLKIK